MPQISGNTFIELHGDKHLARQLKQLAGKEAPKIMRKAVSSGLNPIKQRAKELANEHFRSNTIAKMIAKSAKVKKGKVVGRVYVHKKPDRTVTVEGREVPFEVVANILEFGSGDRKLPPHSYMRRARDEKRQVALAQVTSRAKLELKAKGLL